MFKKKKNRIIIVYDSCGYRAYQIINIIETTNT